MQSYSKQNPFLASVKSRYTLSKSGSEKKTQHLVLDIKGSNLTYEVGDSVGIFALYDPEIVEKTLRAMKANGNEMVQLKNTSEKISLSKFLTSEANITDVSPKLFKEVFARQSNPSKKADLEFLLKEENRDKLKSCLNEHEVWDFLLSHSEVEFKAQEVADMLMPMLPRFYSISSSQRYVGDEIHLTIAPLEYESRGYKRRGVCTHFLCSMTQLHNPAVPIFIQSSHGFRLPSDVNASMIMIGPGTGVAPFRAFIQERLYHKSKGKHWLFFGEWNRHSDFFYEEDWNHFATKAHLRVDAVFSRDQANKMYVQHKLEEHGKELFKWIEEGAYIYVCGDAQRMAKDVEVSLQNIIQKYGFKEEKTAKEYIKSLRQEKRYLRDVY